MTHKYLLTRKPVKFGLMFRKKKRFIFHEFNSLRASVCNIFNLYINDLDKINKLSNTVT